MTDNQENKRSMYIAVQNVCNTNNSIWSGLPAFVTAFAEYQTTLTGIDTQRQIQEGKTTGITENKQKEEDEMIQITIEVAAAVFAYASKISDNELRDKVSYSPSALRNSRDTILKDICQVIHDEANNRTTRNPTNGIINNKGINEKRVGFIQTFFIFVEK